MTNELPTQMPCGHCGYKHHKKSGWLKYYVGALVCPRYVSLLLEEVESWGMPFPATVKPGREHNLKKCNAPEDKFCAHKGTPDDRGIKRCLSPDGFSAGIRAENKLKILDNGEVDRNDALQCEHIGTFVRQRVKPSGIRARPHGSKNHKVYEGNLMPSSGDARKSLVYRELWRRIEYLKMHNIAPTPERIAFLAGHAAWKKGDVHVD